MKPHSRSALLGTLLAGQEKYGGLLPWREFMRLALYDPEFGYYSRNISGVGREADFSTAPTLSALPARAAAHWQKTIRRQDRSLQHAPFIEIGAGNGDFAHRFLQQFSWFGRRPAYWIVEVSPPLRALQEKTLRGKGVCWFNSVQQALEAAGGEAIFFCNELVDAFPCSRWVFREDQWLECAIRIEGDKVFESVLPTPLPASTIFLEERLAREGQKVETHESFRDWLAEWTPLARHVAMLLIDYGSTADFLYQRQPGGSLRGFWRQERVAGAALYSRMGHQDLTADVNFSDLVRWSEGMGWRTTEPQSFASWLSSNYGSAPLRRGTDQESTDHQRFLDVDDAGGAFMVLGLHKLPCWRRE